MQFSANALLIVAVAAGSVAVSPEQTLKPPVAEVLGNPIYESDLAQPVDSQEQLDSAGTVDEEEKLRRDREQLRGLVWSAVFRDYAVSRQVKATEEEVESLQLRTHGTARADGAKRLAESVAAHRKRIQEEQEKIAQYQRELSDSDLTSERRRTLDENLGEAQKLVARDQEVLVLMESEDFQKTLNEGNRRVAQGIASQWKLNQTLYQEYGGRIIFQQFGWEPIDAYRQLIDEYKAAKKFEVFDSRFDGAVYSYFNHKFVYADSEMADFYFEKPWWQRTDQEMEASGFK